VVAAAFNGFAVFDITDAGNDTLEVASTGMVMLDMDFMDVVNDHSFLFLFMDEGMARPANGEEFVLIDNLSSNPIDGTLIDPNFGAAGFPPLPGMDTSAELEEGDFFQVEYDADPGPDVDVRYRMFQISYEGDGTGGGANDLVITHINRAPDPQDSVVAATEDLGLTAPLDTGDPDNDPPAAVTVTVDPTDGTVANDGTYTPNANFSGTDSFAYTVSDGEISSDPNMPATVTINVAPVADEPTFSVNATSLTTDEDEPILLGINAAVTDTDGSEQLDVRIFNIPVGVSILWDDGGMQSFTATAGNTELTLTDTNQTVLDTVMAVGPLNDASDFSLFVDWTVTDTATFADNTTATDTITTDPADVAAIDITVEVVVDGATPSTEPVSGTENTPIDLMLGIDSSDPNADPDEVITLVRIEDVPDDAILVDSAGVPHTPVSQGTYEFSDPNLLTGLSIIKEDGDEPFTLVTLQVSFEATDVDPDTGDTVSVTSPQLPLEVQVENTPPVASIAFTGSGQTVAGFATPFNVSANDANPNDDPFTYTIDWGDGSDPDGDGTPGEVLSGLSAFESITHAFTNFGTITVTVTATDADGGTGPSSSTQIEVVPVAVINGDIFAGGTANSDTIIFYPSNSGVMVRFNTTFFGPFQVQAGTQLLAFGQGGNDRIVVAGEIGAPAVFDGGVGNDHLNGLGDDDTLIGGSGNDVLLGGEGDNLLIGDRAPNSDSDDLGMDGSDRLEGRSGVDYIYGGGANDRINGGAGDDVLDGGEGNDFIFGGMGHDLLWGGGGSDLLNGHFGNDVIFGGGSTDQIFGSHDQDLIVAGDGRDRARGDDGDDVLVGGNSNLDTRIEQALDSVLAGMADELASADMGVGMAVQMWINSANRLGFLGFRSDNVGDDLAGGPGADEFHGSDGLRDFRPGEDSVFF